MRFSYLQIEWEFENTDQTKKTIKPLFIDKRFQVLQPGNILLLFLQLCVIWNEDCKGSVDASFLEISFHENLQVFVELLPGWTAVTTPCFVFGLCGFWRRKGVGIEGDIVDDENGFSGSSMDRQCSCIGALKYLTIDIEGGATFVMVILVLIGAY